MERAELASTVTEFANELARRKRTSDVNTAWELYRGSLTDNADAVADALYDSHVASIEEVEMSSLDAAIRILGELGLETRANDLIDRFIHRTNPLPDYDDFPFLGLIQNRALRERWKAASTEVPDTRSISETIESFSSPARDVRRDLARLSTFSADDFYTYFTGAQVERLFSRINVLSNIEWRLPDLDETNRQIEGNVKAALERLSTESKINEIRLRNLLE